MVAQTKTLEFEFGIGKGLNWAYQTPSVPYQFLSGGGMTTLSGSFFQSSMWIPQQYCRCISDPSIIGGIQLPWSTPQVPAYWNSILPDASVLIPNATSYYRMDVEFDVSIYVDYNVENLSANSGTYALAAAAVNLGIFLPGPAGGMCVIQGQMPAWNAVTLAAYDGQNDFRGASGARVTKSLTFGPSTDDLEVAPTSFELRGNSCTASSLGAIPKPPLSFFSDAFNNGFHIAPGCIFVEPVRTLTGTLTLANLRIEDWYYAMGSFKLKIYTT